MHVEIEKGRRLLQSVLTSGYAMREKACQCGYQHALKCAAVKQSRATSNATIKWASTLLRRQSTGSLKTYRKCLFCCYGILFLLVALPVVDTDSGHIFAEVSMLEATDCLARSGEESKQWGWSAAGRAQENVFFFQTKNSPTPPGRPLREGQL